MYRSRGRIIGRVFPLSFSDVEKELEIVGINAGKGLLGRLARMGIYVGTRIRIKVISNGPGPLIISLGEKRIGIGRGMSNKIMVREV